MNIHHSKDEAGAYTAITAYVRTEVQFRDGELVFNPFQQNGHLSHFLEDAKKLHEGNTPKYLEESQGITLHDHYVALNTLKNVGDKWQINETIYDHFLEMLPPINTQKGFMMLEANSNSAEGPIRSHYFKEDGKYWHQVVLHQGRNIFS